MARDVEAERAEIESLIAGKTIPSALQESARLAPEVKALNWKEDGEWKHLTFPEYREAVRDVCNAYLSIGLKPGEFAVFMARNIPEHYLADLGAVHAQGVGVSLYNTLAPEQIAYIVNHCEASYAVLENRDIFEKFLKIREETPNLRKVILIEGADEFAGEEWVMGWDEFIASGKSFGEKNPNAFDESWKKVKQDDLLTLIYTSGTTGPPKGVMIDHRNVLFVGHILNKMGNRQPGDRVISYLPMAHIAERAGSIYLAPIFQTEVYCCSDFLELGTYLAEVKPTIFFGVPRVFEKMHAALLAGLAAAEETPRQMAEMAIETGRQVASYEQKGEPVPDELQSQYEAVQMVLEPIRARLGLDECRHLISGAAPISTEVLEFFHAIGLKIAEIYGQSEDTGPTSLNPEDRIKIGTVGPPLPGVEVKLAEDGELLVRGPNVSKGYYKDPELTAQTFDEDGWLHSGDICEIDEDGYLKVVDRKKEIIITAGGKNIAPSNLENALKQHGLIGQAVVIGDRRPYVTALIVLDPEVAPGWAKQHGIEGGSPAELADNPTVVEEAQRIVDEVNKGFSKSEQIKKFTILPTEWTAESEELTPTLKVKRRVIGDKYDSEIERMYK
ncbi:MAG: AMP-dependent synthetase/ligase [Actinomycetota bacterium]